MVRPQRITVRALPSARRTVYADRMNESSSSSIGRTVLAVLVLAVALWVLLHFVIHIVAAIAGVVVMVLAVIAVIWALRVIL
jgi:uncharacterized membrane protein